MHCVKNVHIRSYSGPHFSTFGMNTERYGISPYSVRMRENVDQNNSKYGHFYAVTGRWIVSKGSMKYWTRFKRFTPDRNLKIEEITVAD